MEWANSPVLNLGMILAWLLLSGVVAYKHKSNNISKERTVSILALAAGWTAYSLSDANALIGLPRRLVDVLIVLGGVIMFGGFGYELWLMRNITE